jgi:hypothetical protein
MNRKKLNLEPISTGITGLQHSDLNRCDFLLRGDPDRPPIMHGQQIMVNVIVKISIAMMPGECVLFGRANN